MRTTCSRRWATGTDDERQHRSAHYELPQKAVGHRARREAGLTQAQIAELMGTKAPAIARLESSLATGKHSPSLNTLRKYAAALGKRVEVHLV